MISTILLTHSNIEFDALAKTCVNRSDTKWNDLKSESKLLDMHQYPKNSEDTVLPVIGLTVVRGVLGKTLGKSYPKGGTNHEAVASGIYYEFESLAGVHELLTELSTETGVAIMARKPRFVETGELFLILSASDDTKRLPSIFGDRKECYIVNGIKVFGRIKENFNHTKLFGMDYDPAGTQETNDGAIVFNSPDEFLSGLNNIIPLNDAGYVCTQSVSSGVGSNDRNRKPTNRYHFYFVVPDDLNVREFKDRFMDNAVVHHMTWFKKLKNRYDLRTFIDMAIYSTNALMYEGLPRVNGGYTKQGTFAPILKKGGDLLANLSKVENDELADFMDSKPEFEKRYTEHKKYTKGGVLPDTLTFQFEGDSKIWTIGDVRDSTKVDDYRIEDGKNNIVSKWRREEHLLEHPAEDYFKSQPNHFTECLIYNTGMLVNLFDMDGNKVFRSTAMYNPRRYQIPYDENRTKEILALNDLMGNHKYNLYFGITGQGKSQGFFDLALTFDRPLIFCSSSNKQVSDQFHNYKTSKRGKCSMLLSIKEVLNKKGITAVMGSVNHHPYKGERIDKEATIRVIEKQLKLRDSEAEDYYESAISEAAYPEDGAILFMTVDRYLILVDLGFFNTEPVGNKRELAACLDDIEPRLIDPVVHLRNCGEKWVQEEISKATEVQEKEAENQKKLREKILKIQSEHDERDRVFLEAGDFDAWSLNRPKEVHEILNKLYQKYRHIEKQCDVSNLKVIEKGSGENMAKYLIRPDEFNIKLKLDKVNHQHVITTVEHLTGLKCIKLFDDVNVIDIRIETDKHRADNEVHIVESKSTQFVHRHMWTPLSDHLNEINHLEIVTIGDGTDVQLDATHTTAKGSNEYMLNNVLVKISQPHKNTIAGEVLNFELLGNEFVDRHSLELQMILDRHHQDGGRNQLYRYRGKVCVVVVDPKYGELLKDYSYIKPRGYYKLTHDFDSSTISNRIVREIVQAVKEVRFEPDKWLRDYVNSHPIRKYKTIINNYCDTVNNEIAKHNDTFDSASDELLGTLDADQILSVRDKHIKLIDSNKRDNFNFMAKAWQIVIKLADLIYAGKSKRDADHRVNMHRIKMFPQDDKLEIWEMANMICPVPEQYLIGEFVEPTPSELKM